MERKLHRTRIFTVTAFIKNNSFLEKKKLELLADKLVNRTPFKEPYPLQLSQQLTQVLGSVRDKKATLNTIQFTAGIPR